MKEFDLELAKAGHPVQTRDGKKARILCFDRIASTPIVALVKIRDTLEKVYQYDNNGRCYNSNGRIKNDLVMDDVNADTGLPYCGKFIYPSESDAVTHNDPADASDKKVSITKIEWEE